MGDTGHGEAVTLALRWTRIGIGDSIPVAVPRPSHGSKLTDGDSRRRMGRRSGFCPAAGRRRRSRPLVQQDFSSVPA
jgi:hypothetical protein